MELIIAFTIGAVLGSFYNVLIHRLPRGMSIVHPPSHCPNCKTKIRWRDNIPILSYLLLKGRCRYCAHPIPLRYLLVELASGLLAVLCYLKWGLSYELLIFYFFFSALLVASVIDWETFLLPDSITLGGLVTGLVLSFFRRDISPWESFLGAALGGAFFLLIYLYYTRLRKVEGLGFGDVKLMAFIGSFTGLYGVAYAVGLGSVLGLLYAFPIILKNRNLQFVIPYGPFLSAGCFLGVMLDLKRFLVNF